MSISSRGAEGVCKRRFSEKERALIAAVSSTAAVYVELLSRCSNLVWLFMEKWEEGGAPVAQRITKGVWTWAEAKQQKKVAQRRRE